MLRKKMILFFFLVSFVTVSFGQDKQITNDKYKFTLNYPNGLSPFQDGTTVLEFHGTNKKYGEDAVFFLKSIIHISNPPVEKLESYMKETATIEDFDRNFINSMKVSFPDITTIEKSFIYFNDRPAMQSTFSFTLRKKPMKGRYLLLLVKEQSSIYAFSWSSKASVYERWNKASENSVESLKTQ